MPQNSRQAWRERDLHRVSNKGSSWRFGFRRSADKAAASVMFNTALGRSSGSSLIRVGAVIARREWLERIGSLRRRRRNDADDHEFGVRFCPGCCLLFGLKIAINNQGFAFLRRMTLRPRGLPADYGGTCIDRGQFLSFD